MCLSRLLVNYLVATKKDIDLILNFGERELEVKRKVRTLKEVPQYLLQGQDLNHVDPVILSEKIYAEMELLCSSIRMKTPFPIR